MSDPHEPAGVVLLTAEMADWYLRAQKAWDIRTATKAAEFDKALRAIAEGRVVVVPAPDQNLAGRGRGE